MSMGSITPFLGLGPSQTDCADPSGLRAAYSESVRDGEKIRV
jgi:hypothetical protein